MIVFPEGRIGQLPTEDVLENFWLRENRIADLGVNQDPREMSRCAP